MNVVALFRAVCTSGDVKLYAVLRWTAAGASAVSCCLSPWRLPGSKLLVLSRVQPAYIKVTCSGRTTGHQRTLFVSCVLGLNENLLFMPVFLKNHFVKWKVGSKVEGYFGFFKGVSESLCSTKGWLQLLTVANSGILSEIVTAYYQSLRKITLPKRKKLLETR